jgi:GrpB-like predicted nucleotidyltransferase (UPF0157 family)
MAITVDPYDEDWPRAFDRERARLQAVLAPWLHERGFEHIGSTSVPGLAAKPVIDMLCGVTDLESARGAAEPLAQLGYQAGSHRPHEAHWFFKDSAAGVHTHHLHLTVPGSDLWRERLAFRDALRADPELAARYARLKQALCEEHGTDNPDYTRGKRELVAQVLAQSLRE